MVKPLRGSELSWGVKVSLVACVQTYLADKSASMATQVVMFSVLLFSTSGVVLDFGRVYSEHSNMQSYTDQAALAAAHGSGPGRLGGGEAADPRARPLRGLPAPGRAHHGLRGGRRHRGGGARFIL